MRANRDLQSALRRLRLMVSPEAEPVLDEATLAEVLLDCAVATIWAPDTLFRASDRIVPTIPNGRKYRVAVNPWNLWGPEVGGGTSGTTEPVWQGVTDWPRLGLRGIVDGGSGLFWAEDGPEPESLWDLRKAAYRLWMLKAQKAAGDFATSGPEGGSHPEQIYDHCLKMASAYRPLRVSSG